ncbi:hypothetical protein [Actinomadura meridiana]|uniref:hypothetical protein n=1 Tax=Actinomadura meridiana TaxID=559626 RepID=UPI0031F0A728
MRFAGGIDVDGRSSSTVPAKPGRFEPPEGDADDELPERGALNGCSERPAGAGPGGSVGWDQDGDPEDDPVDWPDPEPDAALEDRPELELEDDDRLVVGDEPEERGELDGVLGVVLLGLDAALVEALDDLPEDEPDDGRPEPDAAPVEPLDVRPDDGLDADDDADDVEPPERGPGSGFGLSSSTVSSTGAISGGSDFFAWSPTLARSVRVSSVPMSTVVSSRPGLADAADTTLPGLASDVRERFALDLAAGLSPEPSGSPVPGPSLLLPGSVLTCPPGLSVR